MGKIYCTECGAEMDESMKFCSSCGTPINNTDTNTKPNETIESNKTSNNDIKTKKSSNSKYLVGGIIAIIIIAVLGFVIITVSSPLYSADYTVDTSDYSVSSSQGAPTFDRLFDGSNINFKEKDGNGKIDIWHRNADGEDVDYYLKQYSTYDKDTSGNFINYYGMNPDYGVKIKNTKEITIDGVKGYIMEGTWGVGYERTWAIFVHDNEYYLISFDSIDQEHQDKFLDSFKFKEN